MRIKELLFGKTQKVSKLSTEILITKFHHVKIKEHNLSSERI